MTPRLAEQQLRRYEAATRRQKKKEKIEAAEALVQLGGLLSFENCGTMMACLPAPSDTSSSLLAATPSSASISPINCTVPLVVQYQSLQEDYQSRQSELKELKDKLESVTHSAGRGFPDQTSLKEDDKLTSQYTGLPNYDVLMAVFRMVEKCIPESNQRAKLSKFHCFMLVLMKLRMNPSNYDLAFRFCVHETTVSRCLNKWIQIMDARLSCLIQWPNTDSLHKTMPWCFQVNYGMKVTSIIDCFELFIEKPGDLMSKTATWSQYKHYTTVKYLISITPQGTVSFLSKGYGGRVLDKFITIHSGYLDNIHQGDVTLADRGFNVEEVIGYKGATLNIPAFTQGKVQLSPEEVESTRRIANVRIHVERVIGAVRQKFKILSATTPLPSEYTKSRNDGPILLDSIVRICCALNNVCDSVIPAD